jgi:transcriptional regulator with XRE-family HTH domain
MQPHVIRATKRLTQLYISNITAIRPTRISLIERGYIEPTSAEKSAIATALGVDVDNIDWPKVTPNPKKHF